MSTELDNANAPAAKLSPGTTPRLEHALKCLYATLSLSIPIYILQITTIFQPVGSLWILPANLMFTVIFSSTLVMVTFRDRARMHSDSTKSPPTLPALCRLPTLIVCFLIVVLWIAALAIMLLAMIVLSGSYTLVLGVVERVGVAIGSIEVVFVIAQIGLLLAIGILGVLERKHAKAHLRASVC
jgi:hypothetical protein